MSDLDTQAYYAEGPADLSGVVLDALTAAGRATGPLDPDDLAALDEFHGLGRAATVALAELAGIGDGARVLDVGAGIGGPARTLAHHFGAAVTALDPTERFCALNEELNERTGLEAGVEVVRGDARRLPFDDASFGFVVTQAVWPSVEAKPAMLAEARRVLAPSGKLAIYEAVSGPGGPDLHYPVPWADGPEQSFVVSRERAEQLLAEAGFAVLEWLQGTEVPARIGAVVESGNPAISSGLEGIDLSLVMPEFDARMSGVARNIAEQRIELAMAVLTPARR